MKNAFYIGVGLIGVFLLTLLGRPVEVQLDQPDIVVEETVVGKGKSFFDTQGTKVYTDCDLTAPKRQSIDSDLKTLKAKNSDNSLRELDAKDKANLKGCEVAKIKNMPRQNVKFSGADYDIEIVSIEPIDGGVQVFARAWTPNGIQIGFGVDGTVDIERFRIFNPPILVDDPLGDIVRTWTDEITGETKTRVLREDPGSAIKQSLAHIISVKKERFVGSNIVLEKVGNTTSTFYPNAGTGSGTTDASWFEDVSTSWATIIAKTASRTIYQTSCYVDNSLGNGNGASYFTVARYGETIDTSALPDADSITSATLSYYGTGKTIVGSEERAYVYATTPANNATLVTDDYDQFGVTQFGVTPTTWSTTAFNDVALNASGIANISKTGISRFGMKGYYDANASAPTNSAEFNISCYDADTAGTASDPKLVVEHSAPGGDAPPVQDNDTWFMGI